MLRFCRRSCSNSGSRGGRTNGTAEIGERRRRSFWSSRGFRGDTVERRGPDESNLEKRKKRPSSGLSQVAGYKAWKSGIQTIAPPKRQGVLRPISFDGLRLPSKLMRFLLASDQRRLCHFFSVHLHACREAYMRLLKLRLLRVISSKDSSVELLSSTLEEDFDMETRETDLKLPCSY